MSSMIHQRLCSKNPLRDPIVKARFLNCLSSSFSEQQSHFSSYPASGHTVLAPSCAFLPKKDYSLSSPLYGRWRDPFGSNYMRFMSVQAAAESSTSDGLTVEGIIANNWLILDENESDWKSHAASIAQSIHLIKKRLRWKKLIPKLETLSAELNKPDLWDDTTHAGKISREYGSIMGKMKEVRPPLVHRKEWNRNQESNLKEWNERNDI